MEDRAADAETEKEGEEAMTLRDLLDRATPRPWKWWTSCSWRRMYGDIHGRERAVMMPTNHPMDQHPDIAVTDADMKVVEALVNCADELLRVVEAVERGGDNPAYPVADILELLADATTHLLSAHDCDCDRWERWQEVPILAETAARRIRAALAALRKKEGKI